MPNWIIGPPTPEQVAEHARKYPVCFHGGGLWLMKGVNGPIICELSPNMLPSNLANRCYLPLDTGGLPVDYAQLCKVAEAASDVIMGFSNDHLGWLMVSVRYTDWDRFRSALKELEQA